MRMRKRKGTNELLLALIFKEQTKVIHMAGQAPRLSCSGVRTQVTEDLAVCIVTGTKLGGHSLMLTTHHSSEGDLGKMTPYVPRGRGEEAQNQSNNVCVGEQCTDDDRAVLSTMSLAIKAPQMQRVLFKPLRTRSHVMTGSMK